MNTYLTAIGKQELEKYCTVREGETKLGQSILTVKGHDLKTELEASKTRFVLVGIPEDIGVRANFGKPGTAGFFETFLGSFLNVQSNQFLNGNDLLLAGFITCNDLMQQAGNATIETLSELVSELDKRVEHVLHEIFAAGKIAIVIGGGHNNAYPLIKALSRAKKQKAAIVNIDPHADLRATNRRHSGNGFSYALKDDLIDFYLQVGLHESYNNQYILDFYRKNSGKIKYFSYEGYLDCEWNFTDLAYFINDVFTHKTTGFELDCDSIENMPSSAQTPSGFSPSQIRELTRRISSSLSPCYFHIPEAIAATAPLNSAKLVTYLVTDFIKNFGS
jgi:formiminoglutamase